MIDQLWKAFEAKLHPNAPQIQRDEMRKAFYCGACMLWTEMFNRISPGPAESLADMLMMDSIQKEVKDFVASLKAGKA
jgi:hypothetical protein